MLGTVASMISAVAAAGRPALLGLGILALLLLALTGWVIASKARTANTVAIIAATRTRPTSAPARGRPRSRAHIERSAERSDPSAGA